MSEQATEGERNYDAEAAEQGWTPKENWKGPEEKWTDSKTFVERGEKIAGILKSKVDRLESKVENLTESNKQFGEYHKKTLEAQNKKNAELVQDLQAQLAQAVTDGDGQAYTRLNREIESVKGDIASVPDDAQQWNQLAQSWANDNQWYNPNSPTYSSKLAVFADGLADHIRSEGYNGRAYFSELTRRVKEAFPTDFTNPNKSKPNGVEDGGQLSTTDSKAQTYVNLPADAKAACDNFVASGFMTKEDYLKTYEWDE